jgi:5'-nucleotidase
MNILAVNDDGIRAEGLYRLVETLSGVADVYVCAPHIQRSASSHSISILSPLKVNEVEFENAKLAFEITGTPADCVKLGLYLLAERGVEIDMVFSGINLGSNLGTDTLYSGTVSAAGEGCFSKKPSVAISVNDHHATHFELACELALGVCQRAYGKFDYRTVININTPNLPKEEIKGVKFARLGPREYNERFEQKEADGEIQYWYSGKPVFYEGSAEFDVIAIQQNYAVITPIQYDLTDYKVLEEIEKWRIEG